MTQYSILIVDDDTTVCFALEALLADVPAVLFFANSGQDALHQAGHLLPDLILLDVMMPGMDGFEVCRRLREDQQLAEVPVVMVTALDDRESRLRGIQAGADDFLSKPVDRLELLTRVQGILRLNRYRKLVDERIHFAQELEVKNTQLRHLSQRLVDVQEAERRFIAQELHDDIGQTLTGLKWMVDIALKQDGAEQAQTLSSAHETIAELSTRIRNLSLDLRPAMLDDFGLFAALEWLFKRYTEQTHIYIKHNFDFVDERRFPRQVETAAFRIIQESLTNVARHARVGEAEINILVDTVLRIEIRDCGQGFDMNRLNETVYQTGGLSGMRERVTWLGGEFEIRSVPGEGTTVSAFFELPMQENHG